MSDEACEHQHPETSDLLCSLPPHPWGPHFNRDANEMWPGLEQPVRAGKEPKGSRPKKVIEDIEASGNGIKVGPPAVGRPPMEVMEKSWRQTQDEWIRGAKDALHQVCRSHETFTTEAVWAKVDDPQERRAMVVVVRHGLRAGWMHEDHAMRIHGVWRTRDGAEFPLNKLVPVYRSDIR